MEKNIKIPLAGDKNIHGILRGDLDKPLVIFVHGFTGDKNVHQFFNGARFFEKNDYSTFRFDLYGYNEDQRKLDECTLSLHGEDIDRVDAYFREKGVAKIFLVGHSYGGVSIMLSKNQKFDGVIFWDSSGGSDVKLNAQYIKELDEYLYRDDSSFGVIVGKEMYKENNEVLRPRELVAKMKMPLKFIIAGDGILVDDGERLFEAAGEPKEKATIPGATHSFDEDGKEEELFTETLKFIQKYT